MIRLQLNSKVMVMKRDKFCHASNILLVGHQRRHALSQLCFNSSAVGRLSVFGRSLIGPQ
jgi:hypothetical protein